MKEKLETRIVIDNKRGHQAMARKVNCFQSFNHERK